MDYIMFYEDKKPRKLYQKSYCTNLTQIYIRFKIIKKGEYTMGKGLLIILSGPSGVGKGTVRKIFEKDPELNLACTTSMTTRKPREGEKEGIHYFFRTHEQFKEAIKNNELLEYAEFVGNLYGTPVSEVNRLLDQGKNVLLEIEVQGAKQVQERCPEAISIFVLPPSMEELERRIRGRGSEPEEVIQERLAKAENEMKMVSQYKYTVCNEDPVLAADLIKTIILRNIELNKNK